VTVAGELSDVSSYVFRYEDIQDMQPYLKPNDIIIYSNSTSFDNLKIGDVIVFTAPEAKTEEGKPKVIVHRISEIGTSNGKEVVITQGDANLYSIPGIDFPIFVENYMGKVVSVTNDTQLNLTDSDAIDSQIVLNTNTIGNLTGNSVTTWNTTQLTEGSLNDCYKNAVSMLLFASIFTPENLELTDFMNPELKQHLSNFCNFYHEKTGQWITTIGELTEYSEKYGDEFAQKYPTPESLTKLKNSLTN
jgi:signal peptidase I